ncbi:ABC transporter ATP-binding protein [Kiritimatiellaeota bacterium B1221]|nr:ABC transporter ATP-binding protein [Kiritimatiellaeota bacterium B1221]
MTLVSASQLSKSYAGQGQVLNGVDLTITKGSFECVMGASGSGKSTLLHILSGLMSPDAGEVQVDGASLHEMKDRTLSQFRRRRIGLVFQDFNLIPALSVEENVMLPIQLDGRRVDVAELELLLDRLGIFSLRKKSPDQLSGGERQRVAIARALYIRPAIILADEPTGNLDSVAGEALCRLLSELNKDQNCTILMVTHDPRVAAVSDRLHLLRDGRLLEHFETQHSADFVSKTYLEMMGHAPVSESAR